MTETNQPVTATETAAPVAGVKETFEAVHACAVLGAFIFSKAQDGLQPQDVLALIDRVKNDPKFVEVLLRGYEGVAQVPAEIKDLNVAEGFQLATRIITETVPAVTSELTKKGA